MRTFKFNKIALDEDIYICLFDEIYQGGEIDHTGEYYAADDVRALVEAAKAIYDHACRSMYKDPHLLGELKSALERIGEGKG